LGKNHAKWQAAVVGYESEGNTFVFNVESVSGLKAEEIVAAAAEILEERMRDFSKDLGKLK
jgi:hypothetical protein